MLGHDLARTGVSSDQVENSSSWQNMPILWVRDFASFDNAESELIGFHVQPIVVQDVVYVPTLGNRLHALNAETGDTLWIFDPGEPGAMLHSPAVVGGVAYVGSTDGHLYAVDATTGDELWHFEAGQGGFGASPAVTADTVYIGGRDGIFYALRTGNGTARWTYEVGAPVANSPALDEAGGRVYFGAEDMRVYALSTANGSRAWRSAPLHGQSFRHYYPVLAGDTLFIRTKPAMEIHGLLQEEDDLILQAAGVANNGSQRAICDEDPMDIHASWSQAAWNAEIATIRQFLEDHPEYQTWYALNVANGQPRYTVPILWSQGIGYVGQPPVARDEDHILCFIRSYYSNYDQCNSWYKFGGLGELEVSSGNLSIVNLAEEPSAALWAYGIGTICDEQNMLTLSGDVLYVASHGDCVGGVNVSNGEGVRGIIARDWPWRMGERNMPFMGHMRVFGTGFNSLVPYGDRLYWTTAHTVGVLAEPDAVEEPWTPPPLGDEPADPHHSVHAPGPSALEGYVLDVPQYTVDWDMTADLRTELGAQVSDLLAANYAPLLFMPGKNVIRFYFHDPADLFYTLSIALPYLSPALQAQVKDYLAQEWQQSDPLSTRRYPLDEGARREFYSTGSAALAHAYDQGSDNTPDTMEILYAVWAYAHYADRWDVVADNWASIKNLVTSAVDVNNPATLLSDADSASLGSVNRRTSALIAYTRMAQEMNDTAAYAWGLDAATRSLAARIDYEEEHRPAVGEWHSFGSGGKFVRAGGGSHWTWIPRYRDLTPEIGAALRDYASEDLADQAEYLEIVRSAWYVAWGPHFAGEVSSNFPQHAIDIFNAQAMMLAASPADLRLYVDRPWCRGDLYYMQKLVYAIRAHAATEEKKVSHAIASTGDTLTYTITLMGSGAPMTLTDAIPAGTAYVSDSARREPPIGVLTADSVAVAWTGTLTEGSALWLDFAVTVTASEPQAIINQAEVDAVAHHRTLSAVTIANGLKAYIPVILKAYR